MHRDPFNDPGVEDSYQPAPSNKSHNSSDSNHPTAIAKPVATAAILDSISYDQSPVHKTLETPELLEQILSFVPSLDLCHARRTSQTFRNVIDHSLVLQKNLFLRPHARIPSTIPCSHLIPQWNGAPDFANCITYSTITLVNPSPWSVLAKTTSSLINTTCLNNRTLNYLTEKAEFSLPVLLILHDNFEASDALLRRSTYLVLH
jgi:hypothetical protein